MLHLTSGSRCAFNVASLLVLSTALITPAAAWQEAPAAPAPAAPPAPPPPIVAPAQQNVVTPQENVATPQENTVNKPVLPNVNAPLLQKEIYRQALRSTALVVTLHDQGKYSRGSGWLLDKERRLVITNYHVIETPGQLRVYFPQYNANNRPLTELDTYLKGPSGINAEILYASPKRDIAVLKLAEIPATADAVVMADESPSPGDLMHSIGNPGSSDALWVFTTGTVRSVHRHKANLGTFQFDATVIETQSPINFGDSGGPVVDDFCKLVGIVSAFRGQAQLMSHFVDITEIKSFVEKVDQLYDPKTADLYVERGTNAYNMRRLEVAMRDFSAALRLNPNHAAALSRRADCFRSQRDYQTALQDYNDAIRADPTLSTAFTGRAWVYRYQRKYDEAIADATTGIRLQSDSYYPCYLRGLLYLDKLDPSSALTDLDRAVRLAAGNGNNEQFALRERARAYEMTGEFQSAFNDYQAVLKIKPNDLEIYRQMGDMLLKNPNNANLALNVANEALKLQPNYLHSLLHRSRAYLVLNKPEEAFKDLNEAVRVTAGNNSLAYLALLQRGFSYDVRGELKPAIDDYLAAIKANGNEPAAYTRLGDLLLNKANDPKNAVVYLTDALQRQPRLVHAFIARGRAYLAMGQLELALTDLNEAVSLNPNVASSYDFRGDIFLARREFDAALKDYSTALKLDNKVPVFHFDLANALAAKGDLRGAVRSYDTAISLDPKSTRWYLHRSVAHYKLGDTAKSQADLQKAAELDPKFKGLEVKQRYVNYLRVTNATKEPLQVYIHYYTPSVGGNFRWYPEDPGTGEPISLRLEPGESDYLIHKRFGDMKVKGAKFRIWAKGVNSGGVDNTYKDKDLIAATPDGYVDTDYGTFDYTFR